MGRKLIIVSLLIAGVIQFPLPSLSQEVIYKDVSPGHWAYPALCDLFRREIIKGYTEGGQTFYKGDRPLTRYEFAVALEKLIKNLEEEMVVLYSERAKVEYVDAAIQENARKNEAALAGVKGELSSVGAKSKEMSGRVARLEDRLMVLEQRSAGSQEKPLPKWLVIGTTVVAVTALVIAAGR